MIYDTTTVNITICHLLLVVLQAMYSNGKRNCALLKTKLNINIKTKCIYCVQYIVK